MADRVWSDHKPTTPHAAGRVFSEGYDLTSRSETLCLTPKRSSSEPVAHALLLNCGESQLLQSSTAPRVSHQESRGTSSRSDARDDQTKSCCRVRRQIGCTGVAMGRVTRESAVRAAGESPEKLLPPVGRQRKLD